MGTRSTGGVRAGGSPGWGRGGFPAPGGRSRFPRPGARGSCGFCGGGGNAGSQNPSSAHTRGEKHNTGCPGGAVPQFPTAQGPRVGSWPREKGGGGISSPCGVGGRTRVGTAPGPLPTPKPAWERLVPPPVGTSPAGTQTPGTSHVLLQIVIFFSFNRYKNRLWNRFRSGSPSGLSAKPGTGVASPSPQTIIYPLKKQLACTKAPSRCSPGVCRVTAAAKRKTKPGSMSSPRCAAPVPGHLGAVPTVPAAKRGSSSRSRCARPASHRPPARPRLSLLPCPPLRPGGSFLLSG